MTNALISVVLPFFNAEHTLYDAIESIANQTFSNFECVLVNNNTSDGSLLIAQQWVSKDNRFALINESRQGVMFASNTGVKFSKGKYIARMDADDYAFPERLKLSLDFLEENDDYGVVAGTAEYIPHVDTAKGFERYVTWSNSILTYQQIMLKQFIEAPLINPTAMWRRTISDVYGLYEKGDFPEDYEMWLRWIEAGVKVHKLNHHLIKWNDSEGRLTRNDEIYSDDAFFKIKSVYLQRWLQRNNNHYPNVMVWGASKTSRKRLSYLKDLGVNVIGYIDLKVTRQIDAPVYYYEDLPRVGEVFVLVYIKPIELRDRIESFLCGRDYVEGKDFLFVS